MNHLIIKKAANSKDEPGLCLHVTDILAKNYHVNNNIKKKQLAVKNK